MAGTPCWWHREVAVATCDELEADVVKTWMSAKKWGLWRDHVRPTTTGTKRGSVWGYRCWCHSIDGTVTSGRGVLEHERLQYKVFKAKPPVIRLLFASLSILWSSCLTFLVQNASNTQETECKSEQRL